MLYLSPVLPPLPELVSSYIYPAVENGGLLSIVPTGTEIRCLLYVMSCDNLYVRTGEAA